MTPPSARMVIVDNYDSFTYNLVQVMGEAGIDSVVYRNDAVAPEDILAEPATGIVLSPGPCDPDRAGICLGVIALAAKNRRPLLGVCLGHQAIGQCFGGKVVRANTVMHGKVSEIDHNGAGVFKDLPAPLSATRYHSLVVDPATIPDTLEITAAMPDGTIMGLQHRTLPIHGVQFHPESIATVAGHQLFHNFARLAEAARSDDLANV